MANPDQETPSSRRLFAGAGTRGGPAVVGHRGAPRRARENTLEAFRAAARDGATWVELDARRSADDVVVVHHDPATSDGRPLAEQSAAELARHGVTDLQAVLAGLPAGLGVDVECKNLPGEPDYDEDQRLAGLVAEELARHHAEEGTGRPVLVTSFNPMLLLAVADRLPRTPTGLLHSDGMTFAAGIDLAVELGVAAVCPSVGCQDLSAGTVATAHEAGLAVLVWTVNDAAGARALAAAGVDALCTDDPALIVAAVRPTA